MHEIELSAGVIEYEDRGGPGAPVVFLHGLLMDETLWTSVADALAPDHRCLVPVLPLGAHRQGMHQQADLSPRGIAALVAEFLDALDLRDVTLVGNDTGGALVQLLMAEGPQERISRVVLVSCDAFDNFPPGLTGRTLFRTGKLPPTLFGLFMQQMRLKPVRRLPLAFGWLTKRGDAVVKRWMRPIWRQPEIRRDTVRVLRAAAKDPNLLVDAAEKLARFDRPTLVVWAQDDRVMPPDHGRRLVELLPGARLVEIEECYTLIPLDQPARLTTELRRFLDATVSDTRSA
ncbi:pimeloyl-ACP methyl ester carboxylesterase [Catenulispora sp. EB89]|uniref:alpha/beta fold hydrolase n=1 Tax=Catenulispora sp. EB89 TaxID=3156257 RepID=UPI0035130489